MAHSTRYTLLMASLPYPERLFSKQTPLSRLRLEERLALLDPSDRHCLEQIETLLHWGNMPIERRDTEIVHLARSLVPTLADPDLRALVEARLELRTLVAALRRRHRGDPPPGVVLRSHDEPWGYGRWSGLIARHWHEPTFRLERLYPWLPQANQLLADDDPLALERLLLGAVWEQLERAAVGHYFDFMAVVIYVLRWNLIDRWVRYTREGAVRRFESLVESGLGDYATLFAAGDALATQTPLGAAS